MPTPMPNTAKQTPICQVPLPRPRVCRSTSPAAVTAVPSTGKTFQRPVRLISCPERVEVSSSPSTIGSRCTPDSVGEMPCTTWRNVGR